MQCSIYITYSPKTSSKEFDNPITLQLRNGKIHPICCLQSLYSTDLKYDLASQQRKPIATEQWSSRCSSICTDPSHQALHPKSNYTTLSNVIRPFIFSKINQINTHHNRSEPITRSPETTVIHLFFQSRNKSMLATCKEKSPSSILHYNRNIEKLKLSKPRIGGTRYKLVFIIGYYYDILSL